VNKCQTQDGSTAGEAASIGGGQDHVAHDALGAVVHCTDTVAQEAVVRMEDVAQGERPLPAFEPTLLDSPCSTKAEPLTSLHIPEA